MNTSEFLLLKVDPRTGALLGDRGLLSASDRTLAEADWSVEMAQLSPRDVADAHHDPSILNCVEPMRGRAVREAPQSASSCPQSNATWGVKAVGAHESPWTGSGVCVAILDTGINAGHQAFAGKQIIQRDFTGEGLGDKNGHGTHCAGSLVGGEVNGKRIGVASGVEKLLVGKILGADRAGTVEALVNGLKWAADEGAQVISLSYALDFPAHVKHLREFHKSVELPEDWATQRALGLYRENVQLLENVTLMLRARSQFNQKCVIVAAAGNESLRDAGISVGAAPPSTCPGVLAVGAAGQARKNRLNICDFSNLGPKLVGPGLAVESAAFDDDNKLYCADGTSMATPHVAGVVALWLEELINENPGFTYDELESSVFAHARKDLFGDNYTPLDYGFGLPQAPNF